MMFRNWFAASLVLGLFAPDLQAGTVSYNFAQVGNSYLAFLSGDSPLIGREVTSAKIFLDVEIDPGSDGAFFYTNIAFPIAPLAGNDGGLALLGEELGWSGDGTFSYFEETDRFNGHFVSARFGAETPGEDFEGRVLDGSRIEFTYVPEPGALVLIAISAMSIGIARIARRA